MLQGGDFSRGDGTGGESIYGGNFKDEAFPFGHERAFLLSMANCGPDTNGSQFFITTNPAEHLDKKHVVFGCVIDGQDVVRSIENVRTGRNDKPNEPVVIQRCGELELVKKKDQPEEKGSKDKKKSKKSKKRGKSDSSESDSSDSESSSDSRPKKKKSKKKHKSSKHKRKRSSSDSGSPKKDKKIKIERDET